MSLYYNFLGKILTETSLFEEWELAKRKPTRSAGTVYYKNKDLGVELATDTEGKLHTIFLFGTKQGRGKPFVGELPDGLQFDMSREAARKLLGAPTRSSEKGGIGIMAVEQASDKWIAANGQSIHLEYATDDNSISRVTLEDVELIITTLYDGLIAGSHHSIYLQDIDSQADAGAIWDTKAPDKQIAHVGAQMVGISIPRYAETYLTASLLNMRTPQGTLKGIDRWCEFSIEVTNTLQIGNYFAEFTTLDVPAGIYRVRLMCWFLDSVKSDDEGNDKYNLELWRDSEMREMVILK